MKKTVILSLTLSSALLLSGCIGMSNATTGNANNEPPTNLSHSGASSHTNLAGSLLSELNGGRISAESIAGNWKFSGPDSDIETENLLMKAGGEIAAARLETSIKPYLEKIGIKKGKFAYTFNPDGTYSMTIGGRKINGMYTLDTKTKTITMTYLGGLGRSTAHVSLTAGKLSLLYEADKLLALFQNFSALTGNNPTLSTLSSLLNSYNGLLIGLEMTR